MKRLRLYRFMTPDGCIVGRLYFGDTRLYTIERPWLPDSPGGTPFLSCVPAGTYRLIPHTRPDGAKVVALVNHGLGVYYLDTDRPNKVGRYLILIHAAWKVEDLAGCIAVGLERTTTSLGERLVQPNEAIEKLMAWLGDDEAEIFIHGDNEYAEAA